MSTPTPLSTWPADRPHRDSLCWTRPDLEHGHCPSSTECTAMDALELACYAEQLAADGRQLPELQRAWLDAWNVACVRELCDSCHRRVGGHGHFGLYCLPCSELPYGVVAR